MVSHKRKASRALEPLPLLKASPATATKGKTPPSPESRALANLRSPTSFNFRFGLGKSDDQQFADPGNRSHSSPTDKENRNAPTSPLHIDGQRQTETNRSQSDARSPIKDVIKNVIGEPPPAPTHRPSTPPPLFPPQVIVNLASSSPALAADTTPAAQFIEHDSCHITITIPEPFTSPTETVKWTPPPRPTWGDLRPMSRRRSRELLMERWMESDRESREAEMLKQARMGLGFRDGVDEGESDIESESEGGNTDGEETEGKGGPVEE